MNIEIEKEKSKHIKQDLKKSILIGLSSGLIMAYSSYSLGKMGDSYSAFLYLNSVVVGFCFTVHFLASIIFRYLPAAWRNHRHPEQREINNDLLLMFIYGFLAALILRCFVVKSWFLGAVEMALLPLIFFPFKMLVISYQAYKKKNNTNNKENR